MKAAEKWRKAEQAKKGKANISFDIRKSDADITYLGMDDLAFTAEGKKESEKTQSLWRERYIICAREKCCWPHRAS